MDGLLKLQSIKITDSKEEADLKLSSPAVRKEERPLTSAEDALQTLRAQPDFDTLTECLSWLCKETGAFDIRVPSPKATQIANILAQEIVPNYWGILSEARDGARSAKRHLIRCFRSVVGIGSLTMQLKELTSKPTPEKSKEPISATLQVLETTLRGVETVGVIADDVFGDVEKTAASLATWESFVSYLGGGKVINAAASAELVLRGPERSGKESFLSDGPSYARWLGRNIRAFKILSNLPSSGKEKAKSKLFTKAWYLGYRLELVQESFSGFLSGNVDAVNQDIDFLHTLKHTQAQDVAVTLLQIWSRDSADKDETLFIGGLSALLGRICGEFTDVSSSLAWWLVNDPEKRAAVDIKVRRAIISALYTRPNCLEGALESLLKRFGDKLYIQNTPMVQQEVHTQDLMLMIGRVGHGNKDRIKAISKTSPYLSAISNRLGASSPRAVFLGMVLGMAVSQLVDPPGQRLKFEDDRLATQEAEWYRGLVRTHDDLGALADLEKCAKPAPKPKAKAKAKPSKPPSTSKPTKTPMIQEASSTSSEEDSSDADLPAHAKPDSDASDSEDDPTLVDRSKPKPPVYIRDLLRGLRDTENFDRHRLALTSAADLIRRKANFGTEVAEHAAALAAELAGARDAFDMDDFEELRLRGTIAVIVARPAEMGPWFAAAAFTGDYSAAQRASVLTALTMAARELAGFRERDAALTGAHTAAEDSFPSRKRLPPQLEAAFGPASAKGTGATRPLSTAAAGMQASLLRPLAASAASTLAGPAAVQLRTASVTKSGARPAPVRRVDNKLARLLADSFFHPLAGRFRLELSHGARSPFASPALLAHLLKTLALLVAAAGPATLSLPGVAAEVLSLCAWPPVRAAAAAHAAAREAALLCLLAAVDVSAGGDGGMGGGAVPAGRTAAEQELVRGHGSELLEAQAWAEAVFESTPAGKGQDEMEASIRQLAAGVLVRIGEVVERYQREMLGELARFS